MKETQEEANKQEDNNNNKNKNIYVKQKEGNTIGKNEKMTRMQIYEG